MSDWLKTLKKTVDKRAEVICILGIEGSGKTSLAAQYPESAFMMSENETGLLTLVDRGLIPPRNYFPQFTTWQDVRDATSEMIESKDRPKALVVDTANGLETLLHKQVCDADYDGKMTKKGFLAYAEGPKAAVVLWREWLADLDRLRTKGTTILLLCHTTTAPFKNPEGPDYDRYVAEMATQTWAATKKFCDAVIFVNFHAEVADVDRGKGKGKGGRTRIYHCERSAAFDAKNRHGLPSQFIGKGSAKEDFAELVRLIGAGKTEAGKAKG